MTSVSAVIRDVATNRRSRHRAMIGLRDQAATGMRVRGSELERSTEMRSVYWRRSCLTMPVLMVSR
jgi:hypothetical protein